MYREMVKAKTAAKSITYNDVNLKRVVLETVRKASSLVGSTLGPNGRVVLIERQEHLPPFATKDGITVFNSMAFADPTAQAVLEAARDSSSKTNTEAGDGTTTATILAESLIRLGFEYLEKNPKLSMQKVMRELEWVFQKMIVPFVQRNSIRINNQNSKDLLRKVAMIATNSDEEMADAVVSAFDLVGHNGQITIDEMSGFGYKVEKIEGFPVASGFEDSCGRFLEEFINDRGNYRTVLEKPRFILYHGKITEPGILIPVLHKVAEATGLMGPIKEELKSSPNVVIVAHHFSESVLAFCAQNFKNPETLNLLPMKTVMNQFANSPYHFLHDLSAFTGAEVFDPLNNPIEKATAEQLGTNTITSFEMSRYKSLILGEPSPAIMLRAEDLEQQAKQANSELDAEILRERLALLVGGVARVKVLGSSQSEIKERRHRVEDAVMAIKGALKEGVLPGCAKTLLAFHSGLSSSDSESVREVLAKAFLEPFERILRNGGASNDEISSVYTNLTKKESDFFYTYNALTGEYGDAVELGVVDSSSAVLMAIKNSLSVAKMLMGLSGIVVFKRDMETEVEKAKDYENEHQAIQEALREQEKEKWEPPL